MNILVTFYTMSDLIRFVRKAKIKETEIIDKNETALVLPAYLLPYAAEEKDLVAEIFEGVSCLVH